KENYKKGIYAKMFAMYGIDLLYSKKQTVSYHGVEGLWGFDLGDLLNVKNKLVYPPWWDGIYLFPKNSAGKTITLRIEGGVFMPAPSKSNNANFMDFKAFDALTNQ
ncbi:MAG: hypothetical protein IJ733_18870, partial [Lachnospiraceae bacterium]|nr:hypothetical protein [Lachnospiraceae bacterium]